MVAAETARVPGLTPEQHEIRRFGVGSSEAAQAMGILKWKSATIRSLWRKKRAAFADDPEERAATIRSKPNVRMRMGTHLEEAAGAIYEELTGVSLRRPPPPGTFHHSKLPHLLSSPDFLSERNMVVEIKVPGHDQLEFWGGALKHKQGVHMTLGWDGIPLYYRPQLVQHMMVNRVPAAQICALIPHMLLVYEVDRDLDVEDIQIEVLSRFWRHVVDGTEPPESWEYDFSTVYGPMG